MDYSEQVKMRLFDETLRKLSSLAFRTLITIGVRDFDSFQNTKLFDKLHGSCSSNVIFELVIARNRLFNDWKNELPLKKTMDQIQKIDRKSVFDISYPDMAFYEIPPKSSILRKTLPVVFFAQNDIEELWDTSKFTRALLRDMLLLSSDQWQKLNAACIYPEDPAEILLSMSVGFLIRKNLGQDIFLGVINALRTFAQEKHAKFNEKGPSIVQDKPFASESEIKQIKKYKLDSFKLPCQVLSLCERYNIKYWGELANISEKDVIESDGFVFDSLEKISFFWNLTPFVDVAKKEIDTWEEENFLSFSVMVNNYIGSIIEDNRNQNIVMARLGLIDGGKQTLQQIAEEIQVTRERVRQIESKCLQKLKSIKNLKKLNRFWYAIEEILRLNRGVCSLPNLSKLLTNKMQWSNDPEPSAVTGLAILHGRFQLEKENNLLSDPNHKCLKCVLVREAVEQEMKNNKKEITFEEARAIINRVCDQKDECRIDAKQTRCPDDFLIYLIEHSDYLKTKTRAQLAPLLDSPKASEPFIKDILTTHFQNGFRIDSPIELNRFRRFALEDYEDYNEKLVIGDKALRDAILMETSLFDGKAYIVSEQTKENLKKTVSTAFECGFSMIFYAVFYDKHENWLFNGGIVSADMLKGILKTLCPGCVFSRSYFTKESNITLERELVNCFEHSIYLNYDQLSEMLLYIPLDKIKWVLSQKDDFIWNTVETYTHISRFDITEEEKQTIKAFAAEQNNRNGYLSLADILLDEIAERNFELSVAALHNAIFRVCLDGKYDRRGKIVTRKGIALDALEIMKKHCRTLEQCSLEVLLDFERKLTGESHHGIPMEAAYAVMVRIDATTYVAQKLVDFNVDAIDAALDDFCPEDYIPLRLVTTFAAFPHAGQPWTLFLLESYVRRFSHKFRFEVLSVNSKNCGVIVRKSCKLDYRAIMTDAVIKSRVALNDREVLEFLYTNGYIGKRRWSGLEALLNHAKLLKKRGH